jgi:hypothetical protein
MRVLNVSAVLLFSIAGIMGGCVGVSTDTEDAGAESETRREPGLTYTSKVDSQGLPALANGEDQPGGDDSIDGEALESSASEMVAAASQTGADLAGSESDAEQSSNQLPHLLLSSCPATSKSWSQSQAAWNGNTSTGGNYICNGSLPVTSHGIIIAATLASADRVGSAQYTCSNGTWLPRTGATCNGKVISTTIVSGISNTCSSASPVHSKWIGWYLADLKRCADTAGLNWWVNNYNNDADCLVTDNYHGYGSKDVCWRAQFRGSADLNGNSYSEAQTTGHISAWDEAGLCNGLAYPWTSVSGFGTSCKALP